MQTIREIYEIAVLPLPEEKQLELASFIIKTIHGKGENGDEDLKKMDGDITKFAGMYDSSQSNCVNDDADESVDGPLSELFGTVSLDRSYGADNESIDRDLARAYLEDYERSTS